MEHVIPISVLQRLACSEEAYQNSPRFVEGVGLVYPDGWNDSEVDRLALEQPGHLLWLAQHKLVTMSYVDAVIKVAEFRRARRIRRQHHGDETTP